MSMKKVLSVNAIYTNIMDQFVTESIMDVEEFGSSAKVLVCETRTEGIAWESIEYYSYIPTIDFEGISAMDELLKGDKEACEEAWNEYYSDPKSYELELNFD